MKKQSKISLSSFISRKWTKHVKIHLFSSSTTFSQQFYQFAQIQSQTGEESASRCMKQAPERPIGNTRSRIHCLTQRRYYPGQKLTYINKIITRRNQKHLPKVRRRQLHALTHLKIWYYHHVVTPLFRNIRRVRQMISKQLKIILLVMRWTVGRRNLRSIAVKDYHLFRFIRNRKLDLPNFNQVAGNNSTIKIIARDIKPS